MTIAVLTGVIGTKQLQVKKVTTNFCEKLETGEYKVHQKNGKSKTYDFLIWAGLPSDFPKILYPSNMKNYLSKLFSTQKTTHVNLVSLTMKNSVRYSPFQIYLQQLNSDEYEDKVITDGDSYGYSYVSFKNMLKLGPISHKV